MKFESKKVLVIAPHPDDETLGVGGTIKKMTSSGVKVSVLVVAGHTPPIYTKKSYEKTLEETLKVFKVLGVKDYKFLNHPATMLTDIPTVELNNSISKFLLECKPDTVFLPFSDRHIDHRVIFDSSVVDCRPIGKKFPKNVLIYETLSETHWNVPGVEPIFAPNFFVNIDNHLKTKMKALNIYKSQISNKNLSRSANAAKALAEFRGSQNGCKYAEGFQVLRIIG